MLVYRSVWGGKFTKLQTKWLGRLKLTNSIENLQEIN